MGVGWLSPLWGTTGKNGAHGAKANRAEVPPNGAGRRAPPCVPKDGESLGAGGEAALPPYLGRPPTLPRCRDPGVGGNPVRAIHSRPAARLVSLGTGTVCIPGEDVVGPTLERGTGGDRRRPLALLACGPRVDQACVARGGSGAPRGGPWLARETPAGCPDKQAPPGNRLGRGALAGSGPGTSPCIDGLSLVTGMVVPQRPVYPNHAHDGGCWTT
jgi:hypothetical protein